MPTPEAFVGALVAERPNRGKVLERLGIDYCCRGATSLAAACSQRSLDLQQVLRQLAESDLADSTSRADQPDWMKIPAGALADHIVDTHHVYLRRELPRLAVLIARVAEAHSANHPELAALSRTFADLRQELEMHLLKEERVLFPLVKQLEAARQPFPIHCGSVDNPIRVMEHEHDNAGAALEQIRKLTGDYQVPDDGCPSLAALYSGLAELEADLHQHIHKENNILFPRAAALEAALMRGEG